jgi:two-component system cell cycle sensor histidine kinase/response regulator CckA
VAPPGSTRSISDVGEGERPPAITDAQAQTRLLEDALRESEQRFRGYFDLSIVGLAITKPDRGIFEVNDHFCRQLGYTREEILRKTWTELTHPDDLRADVDQFERIVAGEIDSYKIDKRFIRKSGEILHAEIAVRCVRKSDGSVDYFLGLLHDVTERVRTLAALRESESRFRLLVENSRDLVMEVETDGRFVYASPNFATVLGLSPAGLIRANLLDRVHLEDHQRVRALLQEPAACFVFRQRHADGHYIWLEANTSRFSPLAGDEHCVIICRDITERIRIEQRSQESAELFTKAFGASPNANSITDMETGEILETNEGFTSFFGYSREEAVGKTTTELGVWPHPEERVRFVGELRRFGFVREFKTRLGIRNGEERTCLVSAETVTIGGRLRLIGVVVDITEREEAERALRDSEEKFSKAFRLGPDALAIADFETKEFIDVNEGFERFSGLSRGEIVGRHIGELGRMTAFERERLLSLIAMSGSVRNVEAEFIDGNGELRWGVISGETTELGGRPRLIFSIHDITERRRVEIAKAALEDQLRHVQKMEAIGTLAGGIAHDFNNILGAMLAYSDLAKLDATGNAAVLESLDEIRKAGVRAKDLVQQILTFSRRAPNERKPTRLQPIVAEAMKLLRSTMPANIRFSAEVTEDIGTVSADATQIHQILVNLCTNAAHAIKDAPGEIIVRVHPWHVRRSQAERYPNVRPGRYAELSVSDTGKGMDAETLERIFEPFFTTKKPGEGTGLGLSVVDGIVKDHGGTIRVESQPGRGTTLNILLPLVAAQEEIQVAPAEVIPIGHGERILFIDDEPALCSGAKKLLEKLNYVVTTETNAPGAVALFKSDPGRFDLVVTDLTMPAMSGVDVATELLRARPGTPVVLSSGFSADLTIDAVRAVGIRELVAKPLSVAELAQTVHAALHPE